MLTGVIAVGYGFFFDLKKETFLSVSFLEHVGRPRSLGIA